MRVYTFSNARQEFSKVLDVAKKEGKVLIRRRDGSVFSLVPEKETTSPFDVQGIQNVKVSTLEILDILKEERGRIG